MIGALLPWAAAALVLAVSAGLALGPAGQAPAAVVQLVAVAGLLAAAAHATIGLTRRPILGLALPLLAGWWAAGLGVGLAPALMLAAAAGLVTGAVLGVAAGGTVARAAAVTLLVGWLAEGISTALAGDPATFGLDPTPIPMALAAGMALAALAVGAWAERTVAARLLVQASEDQAGADLGLRPAPLRTLAAGLGGAAAGLAGALLAFGGNPPPSAVLGLVLAIAVFAGGAHALALTLTLVTALWLLPEALAPALADRLDVGFLTVAMAVLALLFALVTTALEGDGG